MAVKYIRLSVVCILIFGLFPRISRADETRGAATLREKDNAVRTVDDPSSRPHTIAELEAGIIALPTAPISASQKGGDTPILGTIGSGDATAQLGLHLLYRGGPEWAFGAGFLFAPRPTSDTQYGGASGLQRTHARSYFSFNAEGRYYLLHLRKIEAFAGLTLGGVVIADRFTTDAGPDVPSILGTKEVTMRTEGYAIGIEAGGSWLFSDRWIAGAIVRVDRWILPSSPQCSPIGDCTTLNGVVDAFEVGLNVGYRLPL